MHAPLSRKTMNYGKKVIEKNGQIALQFVHVYFEKNSQMVK